jgi:hypothetical protein
VPELQAENRGDRPVLLVDGDQLVGAKQNRIINLTISCRPARPSSSPCPALKPPVLQRPVPARGAHALRGGQGREAAPVTASLAASGRATSDQGAVWASIREKIASMDAAAPTEAMADIYKRHEGSVEEYARAMHTVPGQVGAVFAINGQIAGLELSHTPMFAAHFLKTRGFQPGCGGRGRQRAWGLGRARGSRVRQ